jgi:hypothetical protein
MSEAIRVWTRKEIEEAAERHPEAASSLKVRISLRLLKTIIDFAEANGERIEIISAHGSLDEAELHFFRRD